MHLRRTSVSEIVKQAILAYQAAGHSIGAGTRQMPATTEAGEPLHTFGTTNTTATRSPSTTTVTWLGMRLITEYSSSGELASLRLKLSKPTTASTSGPVKS